MLEAADFKANSQGRFKVKFRNVGLKFPTVGALKGYFSRFGAVEDVHLEDEMPVEDETLDDGKNKKNKKIRTRNSQTVYRYRNWSEPVFYCLIISVKLKFYEFTT